MRKTGNTVNRRDMLRAVASATALGTCGNWMWIASGQTRGAYREKGTGPALIFGDGALMDRFTDSYRVVLPDAFQGAAESFTADRWCADILAIADAAGVERFAWYGFSFGAVVGLQLAARTDRLSALICGGWPPLGGPVPGDARGY